MTVEAVVRIIAPCSSTVTLAICENTLTSTVLPPSLDKRLELFNLLIPKNFLQARPHLGVHTLQLCSSPEDGNISQGIWTEEEPQHDHAA